MSRKVIPLVVSFVVLSILAVGWHEECHYMAAHYLGLKTWVEFEYLGGMTHWQGNASSMDQLIINLSGGIGVFVAYGLLWLLAAWQGQKSAWETDNIMVCAAIALWNLFYAPFEALGHWIFAGNISGAVVASIIVMLIYGNRLRKWLHS